jgi:hypothetical protein
LNARRTAAKRPAVLRFVAPSPKALRRTRACGARSGPGRHVSGQRCRNSIPLWRVKPAFPEIRFYSVSARREEEARCRRRDRQRAEAGQADEVQAANRLIANPRDWRLETNEDSHRSEVS